jgi:hypothetical protein
LREIGDVEAGGLLPSQPERVDRLEQRRVPERRQRALAPERATVMDLRVAELEERHQFLARQRTPAGLALEVRDVGDPVALIDHLHRPPAELALADRRPRIALIRQILQERAQRTLKAAQRRNREPPRRTPEILQPLIDIQRPPLPRPALDACAEPADGRLALALGRLGQMPRRLLRRHPTRIASNNASSSRSGRTPSPNRRASAASTSPARSHL